MLWVKSFHIIFMVTWFAGLFYLPRLFVYHASCEDSISNERFKIMERKLFWGIMAPGAILTLLFGIWLLIGMEIPILDTPWLLIKLKLVAVLIIYHIYCGKLMLDFKHDRNKHSHVWYRWFNEFPVLLLIAIVLLAILKPWP